MEGQSDEAVANMPGLDLSDLSIAGSMNLMEKYAYERDRRIRDDGISQYINLAKSEEFKDFLKDPWIDDHTPIHQPVPDGGHTEVLIIGAGFGGILFAVNLIKAGLKAEDLLIIDTAGGFGGTWWWNRYPGLQCDIESYIYFALLEDMNYMPKNKYASGEEIREYVQSIADKYKLDERAMFQSTAQKMEWDDERNEWAVKITLQPKGGSPSHVTVRTTYVAIASGVLNNAKIADIGLQKFSGKAWHTARWDYGLTGGTPSDPKLTGLQDKRVAFIGTGATGVQAVPHLAKYCKQLYVFQRTPSSVDRRDNRPTDPNEFKRKIATSEGWQKERNLNFNACINNSQPPIDLVDDGWTKARCYSALIGGPKEITMQNVGAHIAELHSLDLPRSQMVRKRATELVKDQEVAKKLQAWYPTWCKRPCFHDNYLQTFNEPNVQLVDTNGKGISRITANGVEFAGKEYPVDFIIMGTGFVTPSEGSAAGKAGITVIGRNGQALEELNQQGAQNTLHGVLTRGFPSLFFPGPLQAGVTANQVFVLDQMTQHVAYIITEAKKKVGGKAIIEPSAAAQEQWAGRIAAGAIAFAAMSGCTPGYLNREGEIDKIPPEMKMKLATQSPWPRGLQSFLTVLETWRSQGDLSGLEITASA